MAMAVDALTIFATSVISGIIYHLATANGYGNVEQFAGFAAVVAALFITLANSRNLYSLSELLNLKSQIRRIAIKWTIVFLFLTAAAFAMKMGGNFSRGVTLTFAATGLAALVGVRVGWRVYLADGVAVRRFSSRKVALIEETSSAQSDVLETLARFGLQPAQHFVLPAHRINTQATERNNCQSHKIYSRIKCRRDHHKCRPYALARAQWLVDRTPDTSVARQSFAGRPFVGVIQTIVAQDRR